MYIDKLYNKLYSSGNINGIKILMSEVRAFSEKEESAWDSFKNAVKHGTKFIGKALKGALIAGAPLAAAIAYLESSSNGRIFLKEHGLNYNQLKTNLIGPTEKAAKDELSDNFEMAGRDIRSKTDDAINSKPEISEFKDKLEDASKPIGSFINGLVSK